MNQLHRHQDEISILQNRRDVDIPTLKAQLYKQRTWMVEKKYQYRVEKCLADGFSVFANVRDEARKERAKWRMANARAYKSAATKAMRNWEAFWQEEKLYRHHVKFSLRNIRRNRLSAMFGIWQYDWMIGKRDRAVIAARDAREARRHKINGLTGFFNQWARKLRHRALINRMSASRGLNTKRTIVGAWKLYVDFCASLAHKLQFFWAKRSRAYKLDGIARWIATVERARRYRGVVSRTHRYQRNRRLACAMQDWGAHARLQHKLRLLEICEREESDPLEIAQAMETVVEGIVIRQDVRTHELQVAHALRGRISDLKLHAAITVVNQALVKKVDRPTAEMIQRRGLRSWESITLAQGTNKPTPAGSDHSNPDPDPEPPEPSEPPSEPSGPSGAPPAAQPSPPREGFPSHRPVLGVGAMGFGVLDPYQHPSDSAAAHPTMPHSSTRQLLERQYRLQVENHFAAHAPGERYLRQAAFNAAHASFHRPIEAAAHAIERDQAFGAATAMILDPTERVRRAQELRHLAVTPTHHPGLGSRSIPLLIVPIPLTVATREPHIIRCTIHRARAVAVAITVCLVFRMHRTPT